MKRECSDHTKDAISTRHYVGPSLGLYPVDDWHHDLVYTNIRLWKQYVRCTVVEGDSLLSGKWPPGWAFNQFLPSQINQVN